MMILAFLLENQGLPRPLIALSYLTYYRSISNTIEEYPTFLAADCRLDEIELVNTVHKKPTTHKKVHSSRVHSSPVGRGAYACKLYVLQQVTVAFALGHAPLLPQ